MDPSKDLETLLDALVDAEVEFILVGGLAAVLHGAPTMTFDVDIVPRRSPENVRRLHALLQKIHAHYRGHPNRELGPTEETLLGPGHQILGTDLGPTDVLGALTDDLGYDELIHDTVTIHVRDRPVRVISLERLIELKRAANRPKDRAVLSVLEATLRRKRNGDP